MSIKGIIVFFSFFLLYNAVIAQNGTVRGSVFDAKTGEEMPGVTVMLEGTTYGTMSDLDGKFSFSALPGTYTLRVSYISYSTLFIENVIIEEGKVALFDDLKIGEVAFELSAVTITAEQTRNTESAILTMKMKSPNLMDGISAVSFRRTGDSDAASSVKRVPGISVTDGKYIYVRGLGDRYTKTTLNGMDIPGLDPDRNTIQMDIFPTHIIDNIIVHKSSRAELPADFTGGVIDIETKDFPETKKGNISLSLGYNPDFHFNTNYLTYHGGKMDFLGFDDGTREIPATTNIPQFAEVVGNPTGNKADRYKEILSSFNPNLAAFKQTSLMDYSIGASFGNQINREKNSLGFTVALSYKNNTEFYEDALFARYGLNGNPDMNEMEMREYQKGNYGVNTVFVSGMAGFAIKTKQSKYRLNVLHLQNGESKAGIFDYEGADQGSNFIAFQHNLDYSQRSLTNIFIHGKHNPEESKWSFSWKLSPTFSKIYEPDVRFTRYEIRGNLLSIGTESGFPERIWRTLQEMNFSGQANATREIQVFSNNSKINMGAYYTFKERDFDIKGFVLNVRNVDLTGNPDELFYSENLWPMNGSATSGTTFETPFIPRNPNQYNATIQNIAAYFSAELQLTGQFKTTLGVRLENYTQRYTGQDQLGINVLDNDVVLDQASLFPSVNMVYNLTEKQNIRLSYSKTIARPSFKELSYAEIYDPISGTTFIGGLFRDANDVAGIEYWDGNLRSSDIHNADIRWELFMINEQTVSLSGFYKYFINPIEMVQFATQTGAFQPRNVGNGSVTGAEFEFRKNLGFFSPSLEKLSLSGNFTYTVSSIELSRTEYDSRTDNARTGQTIGTTRDMAGQAPYIINSGVVYKAAKDSPLKGLEAGLYYNVQGPTLMYVGIADRPDIYSVPFHGLNFNATIYPGTSDKIQLGIKIDNLLNDAGEAVFKSYMADDQLYRSLKRGRTFQLKIGINLF